VLNDRMANDVRRNDTHSSGTDDDRVLRALVRNEIKTTKLVQASTIACSSSAMLEQHGSIRSSRLARLARLARPCRACRVESSRVEPSGIWALLYVLTK